MAGSPFVNQLFQLVSNNVGTFLDPFDLIGIGDDMILEDGTSGTLQLAVVGHPGSIDGYDPAGTNAGITNTSAHAGSPDFGFLDTKKGWKWAGYFLKFNIDIDASEYISADAFGTSAGVSDWLQDPDNLGGDNETADFGIDSRGWVYVDNEDDDWGLTGNARIIKGNLNSDNITHTLHSVYPTTSWEGANDAFYSFTGIYLGHENPFNRLAYDREYSTESYFTTMYWNCSITNFYDTMMSGVSMMSHSHLIGDIPMRQSNEFWNYATGESVTASEMFTNAARIAQEATYYTVNENIILDFESISILQPAWSYHMGEITRPNPGWTSWYYSDDEEKSYHGEIGGDAEHFGAGGVEERPVDMDGYSSPSLKLGIYTFDGSLAAAILKMNKRFGSVLREEEEYSLHLQEACDSIKQSLYASILSKKFTVKMQASTGLSAEDRIGLTGPTTSQVAEMAVAERLSATTSPSTSTGMGSSPSSTGPSGYGGY
jgi:hypothetical protein